MSDYEFNTKNNGKLISTQKFINGNTIYATAMYQFLTNLPRSSPYFQGLQQLNHYFGCFSRKENEEINTSVDDYLAAGCIQDFAVEIIWRLRINLGFIDLRHPTFILGPIMRAFYDFVVPGETQFKANAFAQFLARFQGFYQNTKLAARCAIGPLGRYIWAKSLRVAADQPLSNQDSWIQSHLMVITHDRSGIKSGMMTRAVLYWRSKKTLPTSQIMLNYIGGDVAHPLVEAWGPYN